MFPTPAKTWRDSEHLYKNLLTCVRAVTRKTQAELNLNLLRQISRLRLKRAELFLCVTRNCNEP